MAKYGPDPLPAAERRILVTLSLSNKNFPRLNRLRSASALQEGHELSRDELASLAMQLAYQAIDSYCEQAERTSASIA